MLFLLLLIGILVRCNDIITLTEDNLVSVFTVINDDTASRFIQDILKIKDDDIYIYLHTPGGRVKSGNDMVQVINTLTQQGKNIICIADFAASMGFIIFQSCPTRYILDTSILMQHQMSLYLDGQIERIKSELEMIDKMEKDLNTKQAERLGMTYEEFYDKINNDWWIYGDDNIKSNIADDIVNVICDKPLLDNSYNITIRTFFGRVVLEFSSCPLNLLN